MRCALLVVGCWLWVVGCGSWVVGVSSCSLHIVRTVFNMVTIVIIHPLPVPPAAKVLPPNSAASKSRAMSNRFLIT